MTYAGHILIILSLALTVSACAGSYKSIDPQEQIGRIDQEVFEKHTKPQTPLEEYVSRVGKRMQIVSENASNKYQFKVVNFDTPEVEFDTEKRSITITTALLQQLNDEAELAAVLSLAAGKYANSDNLDQMTATNLFRAGYDPQALIDLQTQYFYATSKNQAHWLATIYPSELTAGTITYNTSFISKMPKGLQRNAEAYKKQLNG